VEDLERAVELDEKIIERINNEKIELETISSKLDYIESAILMFKHQIISNASTEPIAEDIDNVINEAIALDNALTSHRNENKTILKGGGFMINFVYKNPTKIILAEVLN